MLKRKILVLSLSSVLLSACGSSKKDWHISDQEAYQYGYEASKTAICLNNSKELEKEAKKLKDPKSMDIIRDSMKRDIMDDVLSKSRGKYQAGVGLLALMDLDGKNQTKNHHIEKGTNDAKSQNITKRDCSHINYSKYVNLIRDTIQREKEEKAKKEFYATPQGQAYLAQERLANQQQQQTRQMMQMMQNSQPTQNPLAELNKAVEQFNNTVDKHRTRVTNCYGGSYGNSATCYTY